MPSTIHSPLISKRLIYGIALAGASSPGIAWTDHQCHQTSPVEAYCGEMPVGWKNSLLNAYSHPIDLLMGCVQVSGSGSSHTTSRAWYEIASYRPFDKCALSAPFSVPDSVAQIRSTLSLQIKELAKVLGVERPTVYAWLRDEAKPQPTNRKRLFDLAKIAIQWEKLSDSPLGKRVRDEVNQDGRSLVGLLSDDSIDFAAVHTYMRHLAEKETAHSSTWTIRDVALKLGMDASKVKQSQAEFDVLTGKRFDES